MKIKFNKYVEIGFAIFALIGVAGRLWVLPDVPLWLHFFLFIFQFIGSNIIWIFYYNLDYQLNKYYPFEKNITKRIALQLLIGWGITKIIFLPFLFFFIEKVFLEFSSFSPTEEVNKLNIITFFMLAFTISAVLNLGFIANHFFRRWKENEVRAANLEKEKSQVQFDNLKNQLNPHFLFNSLTSLDSLIEENPKLAREFLQQLSKIFRYLLQNTEKGLVSLETELNFIKNYTALLETRFGENLKIDFEVLEADLDKKIVPATTQILIENAIKHNVINKDNPLKISVLSKGNYLLVENNIQLKKQVETSNGQGLNNLKNLYSFLSNQPLEFYHISNNFFVKVPLVVDL